MINIGKWIIFSVILVAIVISVTSANDGYCTDFARNFVNKNDAANCFEFWANRYQSLIGSMVALIAAGTAFSAVMMQITQAERLSSAATLRKQQAVNAIMPVALDELADYADKCIASLTLSKVNFKKQGYFGPVLAPELSNSTIEYLKECVEFDAFGSSKIVTRLIRSLQVQNSRIDLLRNINNDKQAADRISNIYDIDDAMLDILNIRAQINELFDLTDVEFQEKISDFRGVRNWVSIIDINLDDWPNLRDKLEKANQNLPK